MKKKVLLIRKYFLMESLRNKEASDIHHMTKIIWSRSLVSRVALKTFQGRSSFFFLGVSANPLQIKKLWIFSPEKKTDRCTYTQVYNFVSTSKKFWTPGITLD